MLTSGTRPLIPLLSEGKAKNRLSNYSQTFVTIGWHGLAFAVEDDAGALKRFPEDGAVVETVLDERFDGVDCVEFGGKRHAGLWGLGSS